MTGVSLSDQPASSTSHEVARYQTSNRHMFPLLKPPKLKFSVSRRGNGIDHEVSKPVDVMRLSSLVHMLSSAV